MSDTPNEHASRASGVSHLAHPTGSCRSKV